MSACVIAEMACSHDGNIDYAKKIIEAAGSAGADAIQFQIWKAHNIMSPNHSSFSLLKRIELSYNQWQLLYDFAKSNFPDMEVIACVYDIESIDFCVTLDVDAYKIHCADITNPLVVKRVAKTNKRIDLSVGGSIRDEINCCVNWIKSTSESDIWLMYGLQNFPTPVQEINISYMKALSSDFELPIGYQDHSDPTDNAAFWLPAVAVAQGINIIEKHITHDRSYKGVDHEAALNPDEFKKFVKMIRSIDIVNSEVDYPKVLTSAEVEYRNYSRKSILAAHAIEEGRVLSEKDFVFLRSDKLGIAPMDAEKIIGKRSLNKINSYELLTEENIQ